jgi:hypothetical protein
LLQFDYKKRISAADALQHEYFASLRDLKCPADRIGKFNFDFEKTLMVSDKEDALLLYGSRAKRECYDTIMEFHGLTDNPDDAEEEEPTEKKKGNILTKMKSLFKKKKKDK